jgi:hypothetical protein
MIQLQKGTLNTVYLTLTEKMSSASNYTLIRLTCQATSKAILLLPRSRAHDARKDTLTIREGSADTPAVGDIMLLSFRRAFTTILYGSKPAHRISIPLMLL